jgi:uncharacterized protein YkwD
MLALAVVVTMPAQGVRKAPASQQALTTLETGILAQLNRVRLAHGLVPLRLNPQLSTAARRHSSAMVARGFFAHESLDGSPFWKRVRDYYGPGGQGQWSVGENLLWSSPDISPSGALKVWMASAGHRKNILTPSWREIGIAAAYTSTGPGEFDGNPVTVITTDFGVRR